MDQHRCFSHSAQTHTRAPQLCYGVCTEHVQLSIMMMRIYENTTGYVAGKLILCWDLSGHNDTRVQVALCVLPVSWSALTHSCMGTWSQSWRSGPSPAGGKASAEWEGNFRVLVFPPGTKGHHYRSAVVFRAVLYCLQVWGRRDMHWSQGTLCKHTAPFVWKTSWFYTHFAIQK